MTLTGEDTIIINNVPLIDLADGDVGSLTFPNDVMAMSTGKNKNTIFLLNIDFNKKLCYYFIVVILGYRQAYMKLLMSM